MMTELSLRHIPDVSDASLSFQIPLSAGEDLLADSYGDFLNELDELSTPPQTISKAANRHDPLTVNQLTPKPVSKTIRSTQHHKVPLVTAKTVAHAASSKLPVIAVLENTTNARSSRSEPQKSRRAKVPCDDVGGPDRLVADKLINQTSRFEDLKTEVDGLDNGFGQEGTATGRTHLRDTDTGVSPGIIAAIPPNPTAAGVESSKQIPQPSKTKKPKTPPTDTEPSARHAAPALPSSTLPATASADNFKSQASVAVSRLSTKTERPTGTNRVNGSYQFHGSLKLKSTIVNENTSQTPSLNAIVSHDNYDVGSIFPNSGNLNRETHSTEPRDDGPLTLSQISPKKPANQSPPVSKPLVALADKGISDPMSPMRVSRKRPGEDDEELVVGRLEMVSSKPQKVTRTRKKHRADASPTLANLQAKEAQPTEATKEAALPNLGRQRGTRISSRPTSSVHSCESNLKEEPSTTKGDDDVLSPLQGLANEPGVDASSSSSSSTSSATLVPETLSDPPLPAIPVLSSPPTTDVPTPALVSASQPRNFDSSASIDPVVPSSESGSGSRPTPEAGTRFTRVTRAQTKTILQGLEEPVQPVQPSPPIVPRPAVASEPKPKQSEVQSQRREFKKSSSGTATGNGGLKKKTVVIKKDRLASSHPLPAAATTFKPVVMTSSLKDFARPTSVFTFRMESKLGNRQPDIDKENRRSQLREKVEQLKESQKKLHRPHELADLQLRIPDFKTLHAVNEASSRRKQNVAPPITVPLPTDFYTDMRAKKREEFEEKVRLKEAQMEMEREEKRRRREGEEQQALKELRKRAVPKAHGVPDWYKDAPRKRKAVGEDGR